MRMESCSTGGINSLGKLRCLGFWCYRSCTCSTSVTVVAAFLAQISEQTLVVAIVTHAISVGASIPWSWSLH